MTTHLFFHSDAANLVWNVGQTLLDIPKPQTLRMLWDILKQLSTNTSYVDGLQIAYVCCSIWELWCLRNAPPFLDPKACSHHPHPSLPLRVA
ncbi:hypothetical protein QQ045_016021 [Rhodiola kirilowii]